ncbi:MAG: AAC(3) family N-acetyltransferase [Chitinophagaceae bacterium]
MINLPQHTHGSPLFIHTDMMKMLPWLDRRSVEHSLQSFHDIVLNLAQTHAIWMPTFNYRFSREGIQHVQQDGSEIGAYSNYFRKNALWTTKTPVFSVSGLKASDYPTIEEPPTAMDIEAFGMKSIFARLVESKGYLLWLGASLKTSITSVHFSEAAVGGVPYRYDKVFDGIVVDHENQYPVRFRYNVKPTAFRIKYSFEIRKKAIELGIIRPVSESMSTVYYAQAQELHDYFCDILIKTPLGLLDEPSYAWVNNKLDQLGRPFMASDFENQ